MSKKVQLSAIGNGVKFLHNKKECVLDVDRPAGSLKMWIKDVNSGDSLLLPHNTKVLVEYTIRDIGEAHDINTENIKDQSNVVDAMTGQITYEEDKDRERHLLMQDPRDLTQEERDELDKLDEQRELEEFAYEEPEEEIE